MIQRVLASRAVLAFAVVISVSQAGPALAQEPATSIEQLRVLVRPGDAVSVTDISGRELKGTVEGFSESSVALLVGKSEQTVQESDIRTIRQRKDDSLANGARTGFAIGATMGFLVGLAASEYYGGGFTSSPPACTARSAPEWVPVSTRW